jgi:hypothetical protein
MQIMPKCLNMTRLCSISRIDSDGTTADCGTSYICIEKDRVHKGPT